MTGAVLTSTLAVVAPLLTILQSLAQAMRIRRIGADGVSLATWLLAVFVSQTWLCYGIVFHVPAEIWANVPSMSFALGVAWLAARTQRHLQRALASYVGLLAITIAATLAGSNAPHHWILSSTAVASSTIIYMPQLALVVRPKNLSVVSSLSWFIASLSAASWLAYGFAIHQLPVSLPSFFMLPAALIILVQDTRHQRVNDGPNGVMA